MGRFGPGYRTQDESGGLIANGILSAMANYQAGRAQKQAKDQQDADRQHAQTIENIQLGQQGIHLTKPGELPPTFDVNVAGGPNTDNIVTRAIMPALAGQKDTPLTATPSRNLSFGDGYYVDQDEKAGHQAETARARMQAVLAEALGKGQAEELVHPGRAALQDNLTRSTISRNNATASRPVAPIIGSPEWLQAKRAEAGIGTEAHQARRSYDVAHPMPTREGNGEAPQVVSTRKDLTGVGHQQVRAEQAVKNLKSERRQLLNDHPRANRPLSEQRTAGDSSYAKSYTGLNAQIDSAQARSGRLTQQADSITNVLGKMRAHGPDAGGDPAPFDPQAFDQSISDDEIHDAILNGAHDEATVRAHVLAKRSGQ